MWMGLEAEMEQIALPYRFSHHNPNGHCERWPAQLLGAQHIKNTEKEGDTHYDVGRLLPITLADSPVSVSVTL
jgi:hypothetical protein